MNNTLKETEREINAKSIESLRHLIENYSAGHLSDKNYHKDTLRDKQTGIPYIQSICGSALTVLTVAGNNPGENVLRKANSILANVKNYGYKIYNKIDVMVVFAYFKLHKMLKLELC